MSLPTRTEVLDATRQIQALVGLSASFRQSRFDLIPSGAAERNYRGLYSSIDEFLQRLRRAGIPLGNPNHHQTLQGMWGWIWSEGGSAAQRLERPKRLYDDLLADLRSLAEAISDGADTPEEVLRDLRESHRRNNEVFVVMAFHRELNAFYEQAVVVAAERVGLRAVRIDRVEPEGFITEAILSAIRRSIFVLADLTYERPNCYFEAGYAKGAFRRVVFTCREDHDIRSGTHGAQRVHFDVDTFLITWWNPASLDRAASELEDRFRRVLDAVRSG